MRQDAIWWLNVAQEWALGEPLSWMAPSAIYDNRWQAYGEALRRKGRTWKDYPDAPRSNAAVSVRFAGVPVIDP
jgi:hypothetical protein